MFDRSLRRAMGTGSRRVSSPRVLFGSALTMVVVALVGTAVLSFRPGFFDYVQIEHVREQPELNNARVGASTGSFTSACGRNDNEHHNDDNMITLPGQPGAAQHTHEYVGNVTTAAEATDRSLSAAGTTCTNGDLSAYFWAVLRSRDAAPGGHHSDPGWVGTPLNAGTRIPAEAVTVRYRGNLSSPVVAMPRFLRMVAGNAHALTGPSATSSTAHWGCSGQPNRWTQLYPLCPFGQNVLRRYDFPSCWDGRHLDSPTHRSHVVYPAADGTCPDNMFPIPELRLEVSYAVPRGRSYAVDSFPEEHRSPLTDHAEYVNVMPDGLMQVAVSCINSGRKC